MFDWLAKVGKKALEAGVGYFEYQKFLLQLSQMPQDQAIVALRDRVWGMTDAGFIGFTLMVNSMLQQEMQNIQQLQEAGRYSFGNTFEDQMAAAQAGAWGRRTPEQEQALQLAQGRATWLGAVLQYAAAFRRQRPIEGQQAGAGALPADASSTPSPEAQRVLDAIRAPGAVEDMLERAQAAEAQAPRASAVSEDTRAKLLAAMQSGQGMPALVGIIREEYEQQVRSGKIAPERRPHYESVLDRLARLVAREGDDIATKMAVVAECQQLMREWTAATVAPSHARHVQHRAGSRAERVLELVKALGSHVMHACSSAEHMSGREGELAMDFYQRWMKARNAALQVADDEQARRLEREAFRRIACDFTAFSLRHHLQLARPIWRWDALAVDPNRVFISGSGPGSTAAAAACARIGMDLARPGVTQDPGQSRWDQLRSSAIGVFDFTGYAPDLWRRDLPAAGLVAQVGYELGIAFAIGKPVVIVASERQPPPFDVDIEPTIIDPGDESDAAARIADAIDAAIYTPQRGESESSVRRSVEFVRTRARRNANQLLRAILAETERTGSERLDDPIFAAQFLTQCLASDEGGPMAALAPAWPGDYPDPRAPRCFHVTAFREWTPMPAAAIEAACESRGVAYVRGDEAAETDIIRSIWDELCRATCVVADLTEANVNAALELGVAHTLGKPTFIMTQQRSKYFPSIAKLRMLRYDPGAGPEPIRGKLGAFLDAARDR